MATAADVIVISSKDILSASKQIIATVKPLEDRETVWEPTNVTGESPEVGEQPVSEKTNVTGESSKVGEQAVSEPTDVTSESSEVSEQAVREPTDPWIEIMFTIQAVSLLRVF